MIIPCTFSSKFRNNSRLSFIHADAFDPLHAESFALRELYLSGCELNYLPEDLLPGSQNWADLEVVGEWNEYGLIYSVLIPEARKITSF